MSLNTLRHHMDSSTSLVFNLLLVVLVISLKCRVNGMQAQNVTRSTISLLAAENVTTSPLSATTTDSAPSNSELLLSGEEFVDHTEAPTLLFDGSSLEQPKDDKENGTGPANAVAPSSTSSPRASPLDTSNNSNNNNNNNQTITSTTSDPVDKTTNKISTNSDISIKYDESDATTDSGDDNDDDGDDNATHEDDTTNNARSTFEPPQNVSQYMDYIETLFHDLRHQITDLFEPHIPQLIRTSQMVQLSNSCSYDMLRMALALRQFEPWALRMIDSSGKVPEGIFEGSFTALGSYDECLNTIFASSTTSSSSSHPATVSGGGVPGTSSNNEQQQATSEKLVPQTQGKYCLVNVSPYLPPKPPADKVERMFQEEANRRNYTKDDQFSRLSPMFYYMKFRIGVCIPSTCDQSDMESISGALSSSLRLNITIPDCRVKQILPLTSHQLAGGLVFAIVLTIVLGATVTDWSWRKWDQIERQELMVIGATHSDRQNDQFRSAKLVAGDTILDAPQVGLTKMQLHPSVATCNKVNKDIKKSFKQRLNEHWSWMSFSLLTNFKLYFKHKSHEPILHHHTTLPPFDYTTCSSSSTSNSNLKPNYKNQQQQNNRLIIKCLNGIRVLSLCWVIIANSYITLDPRATKRLVKTREAPRDFLFQLVVQASLAIETFFFLSGVLMSLSFVRRFNLDQRKTEASQQDQHPEEGHKKGAPKQATLKSNTDKGVSALKWVHFYIHRYIRMTPATMLVIAFSMYAYRYGDGPLWFEATHKSHQSCAQNWWRHLLHVANFIDTRQMCFIHYWYIAADMQLFLFAPIIMFLLYRYRRIGYALVALIGLVSVGFVFFTTYIRNLPPTLLFYNSDPESRREFGNTIMTKPLTHALPYMVGMLVGKWLNHQVILKPRSMSSSSSSDNTKGQYLDRSYGKLSLTTLLGSIAAAVALIEVFLPYKWNNSHLPTRLIASLYAALFRFGWSLVLAYLVMSCRHKRSRKCVREEIRLRQLLENRVGCEHCRLFGQEKWLPNGTTAIRQSTDVIVNDDGCRDQHRHYHEQRHDDDDDDHRDQSENPTNCLCGSGGNLVNRLLSLDIFTHLSKLSFVAYLIHLPLMSVFIGQTRGLFAFSHTLVIHLALSYLVITFLLSFVLVHIIEFPFITFERCLFSNLLYKNIGGYNHQANGIKFTNANEGGEREHYSGGSGGGGGDIHSTKFNGNNKLGKLNHGFSGDNTDNSQQMATNLNRPVVYRGHANNETFKTSERL